MATYHLRLEHNMITLENTIPYFNDISGCVAILHQRGKSGEHPHYHIWLPLDKQIRPKAIYERLNKASPVFNGFKGNKQWSIREHDSYTKWLEYVLRGLKGQQVIVNKSGVDINIQPEPPVVASPTDSIPVNTSISKKLPMREKFIQHLKQEGWKENDKFSPETCSTTYEMIDEISNQLTDFWKNGFTIPEGERMIRHAAYVFADGDVKEHLRRVNAAIFKKKIFG